MLSEQHLGHPQAIDRGGGGGAEELAVGQPVADLVEEVARGDQAGASGEVGLVANGSGHEGGGELVAFVAQHVAAAGLPRCAGDGSREQACGLRLRHRQAGLRPTQAPLAQQALDAQHEQETERCPAATALDHRRRRRPVDLALQGGERRVCHQGKSRPVCSVFRWRNAVGLARYVA